MWKVTMAMNETKEFENFKDACKCMMEHIQKNIKNMSWQTLETTYWIEKADYDDQPPIMFPVIRDICSNIGWVGKGGWVTN